MKRIIVESPFAGDTLRNTAYLRRCLRDCIDRGEAPIASHALYPFVLREDIFAERRLGIELGYEWWDVADVIVFYVDRGISPGMEAAMQRATALGLEWEERTLNPNPGQILRYSRGTRLPWYKRLWRGIIADYSQPAREGENVPENFAAPAFNSPEDINDILDANAPQSITFSDRDPVEHQRKAD